MTRYEQGFMRKCAEYGVDGSKKILKLAYAIPNVNLQSLYARLRKLPISKLEAVVKRSKRMLLPSFASSDYALQRAAESGNSKAKDAIFRNLNWVSRGNSMEAPGQIMSRFRNRRDALQKVFQQALDDSVAAKTGLRRTQTIASKTPTGNKYPSFYDTMADWSLKQNPSWSDDLVRMI